MFRLLNSQGYWVLMGALFGAGTMAWVVLGLIHLTSN